MTRLAAVMGEYALVYLRVIQESGVTPLPARVGATLAGPPADYGWDFQPGESRGGSTDLQLDFAQHLPVGRYLVRATYRVPGYVRDVWHGEIETPDLAFSVIPAAGADAAAKPFREARVQAQSEQAALRAAVSLKSLAEPAKGGGFARYAGFWEAIAYRTAGDTDRMLESLRRYAEQHADVPFYGKRALEILAIRLYRKGDYDAAREVFLKLPDSYERRSWLKRCEEKLAQ
jgi:hypothetical protein